MKLIEAMKQLSALPRKQDDLREKIGVYCTHTTLDTPVYGDKTAETVRGWLQSHEDISQEIARLKVAIQRTNLFTKVTVTLGGNSVTKSISEWIVRRGGRDKRGLAHSDQAAWSQLTDRKLQGGTMKTSQGDPVEVKLVHNFDPLWRDQKITLYREEPGLIDAALEIANAITDVIETDAAIAAATTF